MSNGKHRGDRHVNIERYIVTFQSGYSDNTIKCQFRYPYSDRATVNKVDSHQYNFNRNMAITKAYT